jgi:hypothetical protein
MMAAMTLYRSSSASSGRNVQMLPIRLRRRVPLLLSQLWRQKHLLLLQQGMRWGSRIPSAAAAAAAFGSAADALVLRVQLLKQTS